MNQTRQEQDPAFYDVPTFCERHGIARSYFYDLLRQGRGPKIVKLGRRTMIRGESAAAWRERMEAETTQPAPVAAER